MRVLDLFGGAGGAGMGYHLAGFDVVGVDIVPQPRYPFEFHQADALEFLVAHGDEFDFVHASPPCQAFSRLTRQWGCQDQHPDYIWPLRKILLSNSTPFVIENVEGAPLLDPTMLCGSMFGLGAEVDGEWRQLRRHRIFESSVPLDRPSECAHRGRAIGVYGRPGGASRRDGIRFGRAEHWRQAMGIDWMTSRELAEAIPPAYTKLIGEQVMAHLISEAAA